MDGERDSQELLKKQKEKGESEKNIFRMYGRGAGDPPGIWRQGHFNCLRKLTKRFAVIKWPHMVLVTN